LSKVGTRDSIDEGNYRLKIVGKDAKGKIQISIEDNLNIDLTI